MPGNFSLRNKKIWIAGHRGLVGGAVMRRLSCDDCEILTVGRDSLDLRRQADVEDWLDENRPDAVVLAAAHVGGIRANSECPAEFIRDNLAIEMNVIHAAHKAGVKKLLFLGSSCIYPKDAAQPIGEDALLTGPLEPTNEWYAIAKIAGVKLCQAYRRQYGRDFIAAMPCNLFGRDDTYDAGKSHVIPALIMKMHWAKATDASEVIAWGSGTPMREFLYADDLADALVFLLSNYSDEKPINVGSGKEISIAMLAGEIAAITGYGGAITFDSSHPDGVKRKLLDSSRLHAMGWRPQTGLREGLALAYADYREKLIQTNAA